MNINDFRILPVAAAVLLAGCAPNAAQKLNSSTMDNTDYLYSQLMDTQKQSGLVKVNTPYLGSTQLIHSDRAQLPSNLDIRLPVKSEQSLDIRQLASLLRSATGYAYSINPDVYATKRKSTSAEVATSSGEDDSSSSDSKNSDNSKNGGFASFDSLKSTQGAAGDAASNMSPINPLQISPAQVLQSTASAIPLSFSGTAFSGDDTATQMNIPAKNYQLSELLNLIGQKLNVSWRMKGMRDGKPAIEFFRFADKEFTIPFVNLEREFKSDLTNSNTGLSGSVNAKNAYLESLLATLLAMVSKDGQVLLLRDSGKLIVSDYPANMDRVNEFLAKEIESQSRQVVLKVRFFTYTDSQLKQFQANWASLTYQGKKLGATGTGTIGGSLDNATSVALNILSGPFTGSSLNIDAIAQKAGMSSAYSNDFRTLNNQVVPFSSVTRVPYLKDSSPVVNDSGVVTTKFEVDEEKIGLSLMMLPRILNDSINLNIDFYLTELGEKVSFTSSDGSSFNRYQVPEKKINQSVSLPNGSTLVISGFSINKATLRSSGVGDERFKLLGGDDLSQRDSEKAILMITPVILSSGA
ncbi:hypothetical protein C4K68_20340 [Pokkaliibacter plantistimulans]|uniref:Type II/III secretion system secretin-like domain-containing protein n=1 Tax=Proteobacteria bacterium 228 TaxID=2083153 RepID=A0A2S5KMC1_9PROT|nr:hypothetical protein [Pokkaliibacter plantistimulans]PPC75466.1 hypothetical protein C4K68_20340 [Pokkaliibacter plantistimulans]